MSAATTKPAPGAALAELLARFPPAGWQVDGDCILTHTTGPLEAELLVTGHSIESAEQQAAILALALAAPALVVAATEAAALFDEYARHHDDKGTEDGAAKAERNRAMAETLRAALARAGAA